jgi:transcriptional regulator of acetoin/glycerol metabolism
MYCAAAPIRDVNGQLAAVLDISQERRPFAFDAAAVVGLYATAIENRLLCAQSDEHIVVQLQIAPTLLGTPMEGLVGVGADGRIAWFNGTAARLLGVGAPPAAPLAVEQVLGFDLRSLAALTRRDTPATTLLPNGLSVVLGARMQAADGAAKVHALPAAQPARAGSDAAPAPTQPVMPAPSPARLRDLDRQVIEQTLGLCNGNISKAARQLGVSRGLIHRHLRRWHAG